MTEPTPPALLSHSPAFSGPGRVRMAVVAILVWIMFAGSMFPLVAIDGSAAAAIIVGILLLAPLSLGPLLGATPMHVEIGGDGILTRWLNRERFVRFQDITGVRVVEASIEVTVAGGPSLWLRPVRVGAGRRKRLVTIVPETSAMMHAIVAGMAAARAAPTVVDDEEALWAQRDRKVPTWVDEVLARGADAGDYRGAPLDREALLRVVERPLADPTARAAAAVALKLQRPEPGERERVRIARAATANPRLRIALDAVSDEEEAAPAELARRLTRVASA
jgi:hypothetical protein